MPELRYMTSAYCKDCGETVAEADSDEEGAADLLGQVADRATYAMGRHDC